MATAGEGRAVTLRLSDREAHLTRGLLEKLSLLIRSEEDTRWDLPQVVDKLIHVRSERRHFFNEALFSDPAWDMILELFRAEAQKRDVSVTSLIFASNTPQTTGLRWIQVLEEEGLIERAASPNDRRCTFIRLTRKGSLNIRAFLERACNRFFPTLD